LQLIKAGLRAHGYRIDRLPVLHTQWPDDQRNSLTVAGAALDFNEVGTSFPIIPLRGTLVLI
jgi:hypothetical protein